MPRPLARTPVPRDVWVLVAAAFVIAVGFGLVAPVLPQLATSFGVGATAASVIVSAFALARLVLAPAAGSLVDRLGERPVYVTGLLLVAASSAACAFAPDYWTLLAVRGLGGIGSTMFTISASGLIVRLAPADARGRVSGLYAASFLLGNIAGPVIGGLLASFGLRVPFLAYAVALLIAAAVVHALLGRRSPAAVRTTPGGRPPLLLADALAHAPYRAAVGSNFANGWAAFGIRMALVPLFATAALGAGPQAAGLALALYAGGTAAALTFSGRLADRWGRRPVAVLGLVATALPTAFFGLSGSEPVFLALSVAAGFGAGFLGPSLQATVADTIGSERSGGRPLAVFQMASDVGSILGPLAAGALADGIGYGWAFAVSGACLLAAVPLWLGRAHRRTAVPAGDPADSGGTSAPDRPHGAL
jgi:MFS family permease